MADRTVTVKLGINAEGYIRVLDQAEKKTAAFADTAEKSAKKGAKAAADSTREAAKQSQTFSQLLEKQSGNIDQVAGATAVAGLTLTGVALAAVKTYADFDKAMSQVSATGQDARDHIGALREQAIKLGADTQFSAGEAANGIEELAKAGVSAQDVLGGGLKGALDLAAAGQLGVGDAAEIAATAMTQFKLAGTDVPHVADLLAAAAGKAQGGVGDIAMALKQGGLVASQFGLSIEETTGTLAAFASAGLLGSDAGTSMKTMLLRLAQPSKEASKLMEQLGINAYDASGKFVGMSAFAGQLENGLKDLTDEQRQSALATIFGTDAIRAASILYDQGSAGISQWTKDVDESGFAAKTAAEKTNNLSGDIERLMGSLDSLLISGGEGSGGLLRGLVQGAEGAVDWLGKLDPKVLSTVVGIAGIAGGSLLAAAGLVKMTTKTIELVDSAKQLGTAFAEQIKMLPKIEKGWRRAAVAAGALGLAIAATAVVKATGFMQGHTAEVTEYTNALIGLSKGGKEAADGLNKLLDAGVEGEAGTQVRDLTSAFKQLKENMNPVNGAITFLGDNLGGLKSSQRQVIDQFKAMDAALSGMDPAQASKAFAEISKSAKDAGISNENLLATFPEYKARLTEVANQIGVTNLSAQEYVDWMGGKVPEAVKRATVGNASNADAVSRVSSELRDAAKEAAAYYDMQEKIANQALKASNAQIAWKESIAGVTEQVKENGRTLDLNTEKGRSNQKYLNGMIQDGKNYVDGLREQGASVEDLTRAQEEVSAQIIATAMSMGQSREQAVELASKMNLIPTQVSTTISAPGAKPTKQQVDEINDALKDLPPKKRTEIVSLWMSGGYTEAKKAIDALRDKEIKITFRYKSVGNKTLINPDEGYATGGVLPGWSPGRDIHRFYSPTAGILDLSGGEGIMRPEWVRAIGGPGEVARQNAAAIAGRPVRAQAFAGGGVYQPTRYMGGSSSPVVNVAAPSLTGMVISGTVDLGNGLMGQMRAVVVDELHRVGDTARRTAIQGRTAS